MSEARKFQPAELRPPPSGPAFGKSSRARSRGRVPPVRCHRSVWRRARRRGPSGCENAQRALSIFLGGAPSSSGWSPIFLARPSPPCAACTTQNPRCSPHTLPRIPGSPFAAMCRVYQLKSALLPAYAASYSRLAPHGHVPRASLKIRVAPQVRCLVLLARPSRSTIRGQCREGFRSFRFPHFFPPLFRYIPFFHRSLFFVWLRIAMVFSPSLGHKRHLNLTSGKAPRRLPAEAPRNVAGSLLREPP